MKNFSLFFHSYSHKIFLYLFFLIFSCQIVFWSYSNKIKPDYELITIAPSPYFLSAASFGDNEFLFRILTLRLQNSGDVFAGFQSLKNYDYKRLNQWFKALDSLNEKSNSTPALATYYYAQTENKADLLQILDYLDSRSAKNLDANWWWVFQEIYIAQRSLNDLDLALKYAYKLSENNAINAPLWTKQMPAFIIAQKGDACMAFKIIEKILQENESGTRKISAEEMNFMHYFINERLTKLKGKKFDPTKC